MKAALYMKSSPQTKTAFVATNSIIQGDQVTPIWEPIYKNYHCHIDFAYQPFKWHNKATDEAQVHVVIIGF